MNERLYDISASIYHDMPVYPGDPRVCIRSYADVRKGDPFNGLILSLGSHTGTHIDAPYHFDPQGLTVDNLPLDIFYGCALVREVDGVDFVDEDVLSLLDIPDGTLRLLLKTSNSRFWEQSVFNEHFVSITAGGAQWMVERGIKLVGVDYTSIDKFDAGEFPAHETLLRTGTIILEGLDLRKVPSGEYTLICFPLRLTHGDGAPVRAVLVAKDT